MVNNIERNVRGIFLIEMKDKAKDTTRVYGYACVQVQILRKDGNYGRLKSTGKCGLKFQAQSEAEMCSHDANVHFIWLKLGLAVNTKNFATYFQKFNTRDYHYHEKVFQQEREILFYQKFNSNGVY